MITAFSCARQRVKGLPDGQKCTHVATAKEQGMAEYQKTQIVDRPAEEVFSWVSDVSNLPHYLPPVKEASTEGPAEAGKPGEKVRMEVEIPDRYETKGEGYFAVNEQERRMEWGAETGRDYSGWLSVS